MTGSEVRSATESSGRTLGWLSGLSVGIVPWFAAGVLSTVAVMIRPEAWSPERSFPWLLLASFVAMLGWIGYGSVRIAGFRKGALLGAVIVLAVIGALYVVVITFQP